MKHDRTSAHAGGYVADLRGPRLQVIATADLGGGGDPRGGLARRLAVVLAAVELGCQQLQAPAERHPGANEFEGPFATAAH
jgi:hypothetical protein